MYVCDRHGGVRLCLVVLLVWGAAGCSASDDGEPRDEAPSTDADAANAQQTADVGDESPSPDDPDATVRGDTTSPEDVAPRRDGGEDAASDAARLDATAGDTSRLDARSDVHPRDVGPEVGGDAVGDTSGSDTCVPKRRIWNKHVESMVEEHCHKCHGKQPKFGAPFSLTSYDELLKSKPGQRKVDMMARELIKRDMPPAGEGRLPHTVIDTMVEWATCGQKHPNHTQKVKASAPKMDAPKQPPPKAKTFDVTADNFKVGQNELNRYQCFNIEVPFKKTRFVKRIEPVIDDSRVLHHAVLGIDRDQSVKRKSFPCTGFPPSESLLYGWAPGQNAIQFKKGGFKLEPDDQLILQIHYNNGAGAKNVSDSSGVRLFYTPSAQTEIIMEELGPNLFYIPPKQRKTVSDTCTVQRKVRVVGSFPHMHEIGAGFNQTVTRKDGSTETIIELNGWSFEGQVTYRTPITLHPGDKVKTSCTWYNDKGHPVIFGTRTEDEMCFNFMYVTPAHDGFCQ